MQQLPLNFPFCEWMTFENWVNGADQSLYCQLVEIARLTRAPHHLTDPQSLYIWGDAGVGKSHLLHACCHLANQSGGRAVYLPLSELSNWETTIFDALEDCALVCLDDLHAVAKRMSWERSLLGLYNRLRDADIPLIMAGNRVPDRLGCLLSDLTSRLYWGGVFELHGLSDSGRLMVLERFAEQRGLVLSESVGQFLLHRCPRDLGFLLTTMDRLERASLRAQRRLTIPFVKTVLGI